MPLPRVNETSSYLKVCNTRPFVVARAYVDDTPAATFLRAFQRVPKTFQVYKPWQFSMVLVVSKFARGTFATCINAIALEKNRGVDNGFAAVDVLLDKVKVGDGSCEGVIQ